jgi:hypothetical protein
MHYCGIVDSRDSEWYDEVLKACSSLEVNDFLHDASPYVSNRPLPPYRGAAIASSQGAPSTSAPPVRLVEIEIFHDSHERRLPNYPDISEDEPYMGTSFGQGGGGFNQFGSTEGAISGSDFLRNPGPSTLDVTEPVSSSRGFQSQEKGSVGVPRSSHVAKRTRLQRFMQGGRSALRAPGGHLHPANVPSSIAVTGGNTGPTNELSPDAWSGHSSPHEIGDVNASSIPQHEPHEEDRLQPERSDMSMDDALGVGELQSDAEAPARPSSDVASAIAAVVLSAVTVGGLGAISDTDAGVHDAEGMTLQRVARRRRSQCSWGESSLSIWMTATSRIGGCSVTAKTLMTRKFRIGKKWMLTSRLHYVGRLLDPIQALLRLKFRLQYHSRLILLLSHLLGFRTPYSMQQGRPPIWMLSL